MMVEYNLDDSIEFTTTDDPEIMEMEYDETIVMVGDIRKTDAGEIFLVTKLNEDIGSIDDQYFYTIKHSGVTSTSTSEYLLSNCELIRRFETWQEAAMSGEFNQ